MVNMEADTGIDSTFQGSLCPVTVTHPDLGCPGQPKSHGCIWDAQEAWRRLSSGHTRQDWLLVGKACQLLRAEAMHTAHVNKPEGRRYNQEYSGLLKAYGFAGIDKAVRSKLFFILDNITEIEKWLATIPANKRVELNHPQSIWRAYQRTIVKKPDDGKKPSHVEQLRASLIESQEENARLRHEIETDLDTPTERDLDEAYGSKYLATGDIGDRKVGTKIAKVRKEEMRSNDGTKRMRFVIYLKTLDKPMVLNATNKNELVTALGRTPANWVGASIGILVDSNVMFAGKRTKGLRLRVLAPAAKPAAAKAPAAPATAADDWTEEGDPGPDPSTADFEPVT